MIARALPLETPILTGMAKRGYTRDTIRGGASDWDASRPFSSYLRMLGSLVAHPFRFFDLPLSAVPGARWLAAAYFGIVLPGVGLATVREIGALRAGLASAAVTGILLVAIYAIWAR